MGAEVTLLAAMGFELLGDVLPLLHLVTSLSMQPAGTANGAIDADGFQRSLTLYWPLEHVTRRPHLPLHRARRPLSLPMEC